MIECDRAVDAVVPQILDPACWPSLVFGKKQPSELIRLLHAHAAISDCAYRLLVDLAPGRERVVHVDGVPVGEQELDLAEIAMGPRLLGERIIADIHAAPIDLGRVHRISLIAHREAVLLEDRIVFFAQPR